MSDHNGDKNDEYAMYIFFKIYLADVFVVRIKTVG